MDYACFHELCRAADELGEVWKVEYVLAAKVYIQESEGRIDPGHNVPPPYSLAPLNTRAGRTMYIYCREVDVGLPDHREINGVGSSGRNILTTENAERIAE
jgi:hypothetical protein